MDTGLILRAKPGRSPKVIVTDAYLKPIEGAKVYAKQHYGLMSTEMLVGVTDSAGELTIPALYPGGIYTVRVALLGYCSRGTQVPPVGGPSWIDRIELMAELATDVAKGTVVDANGKPVASADVTTDFGPTAVTDENGMFTLRQMPSWRVVLTARKGKLQGTNLDSKGRLTRDGQAIVLH